MQVEEAVEMLRRDPNGLIYVQQQGGQPAALLVSPLHAEAVENAVRLSRMTRAAQRAERGRPTRKERKERAAQRGGR